MATVVDSYSESNQDGTRYIGSGVISQGVGQSFTGDGGTLDSAKWYLKKTGSPTGNAIAYIYAHSGTFGSSSVPTGSALATSATYDVSSLTTSLQLITFTFSGAEKITLTNGTKYVVTIEYSSGDASNYIQAGIDYSSPSHDGNISFYNSGSWGAESSYDACFYVYKDDLTTTSTSTSSSTSTSTTTTSTTTSTSTTTTSTSTTTTSTSSSSTTSSTSTTTTSTSTSTTTTSTSTTSTSTSTSTTVSYPISFFGIKTSKDKQDVLKQTNPNWLGFSSDYNTLKYYINGSVSLSVNEENTLYTSKTYVNHDLGYYPFCIVYAKDNLMSNYEPLGRFQAGAGAYRQFYFYMTTTRLYFVATGYTGLGETDTYTVKYNYKIFKNNINL